MFTADTIFEANHPIPSNLPDSAPGLDRIPASYAQQRLWFLDQLNPNTCVYNVPFALHLRGDLNIEALQGALNEIVSRHEALRTRFESEKGTLLQRIDPAGMVTLAVVDLRSATGDSGGAAIQSILRREARRPFNLAEGPLVRATLFRLGDREFVLLINLHHIVCDEWSMRVLLRELAVLYGGFLQGQRPALPELQIQYADYALWQRERLQGSILEKQLDYWTERLRNCAPRLELPADRRTGPQPISEGRRFSVDLPPALVEALTDLTRQNGVTLFVTLLASFKALLARCTSQEDIAVGAPVAGRTRIETEDLIGFFVNTLVLRTDLSGDPSFREVLRRVRETTVGAFEHEELPFERLIEALHPERGAFHVPLLQVVFALEDDFEEEFKLPGLDVEVIEVETGTTKFELTWVVRRTPKGLSLAVEYAANVYEEQTIAGMVRLWQHLLAGLVAHPEAPISTVPLLSPDDRQELLAISTGSPRSYPQHATLATVFAARVKSDPKAVAVRYGSNELTYEQLDARANALAHQLGTLGARPGSLIGLFAEPSTDLVVAMMGIIKAGGAYVPLDPTYPKERLRLILEDTAASIVLTQEHLRSGLPTTESQVICLESVAGVSASAPTAGADPDVLAYVIFTSGSTGRPKGVQVTHRGVLRLVCNADYVQLTPADRVAQASNVAFDAATFEIWGALLNGATLVGVPREIVLAPKDLAAHLQREGITTLFLTTALFNQVAAEAPGAFKGLKHLLFGGEACDPTWVRHVLEHQPPERLLHVYGPTETTTFATWHHITDVPPDALSIPIGRPIANTSVYLLDRALQPVPIGVPGELFIGGPGVARGYLARPELTSEKFIPDPFSAEPGARIYRTGDLARWGPNRTLEFLGRKDQQVKIRGFRVELGEIESLLATHPAVRENVVVAQKTFDATGQRLVAYVVWNESLEAGPTALRKFLREKLPPYMIPSTWVSLPELPLNANGKVDRQALPEPDHDRPELAAQFQPPVNAVEEQLAELWTRVLGIKRVGVKDNFFDLGGHSLLAVRLFSQIESEFGRKLPLACIFEAPTVEQLAARLRQDLPCSWPLLIDIQPEGDRPPFFWIHSLGGDGGGAFFYYRKLAQLLGPGQPSFGIRSPREPFTRIEDMAAHYIDELLGFQPQGPYFLGGFCFGGIVAFEMARQLERRGERVGLLALLESAPPISSRAKLKWRPDSAAFLARNLQVWVNDLLARSPAELLGRLQRRGKSLQNRLHRLFSRSSPQTNAPDLSDLIDMADYPKDYIRYAQAHWQALLAYRPGPYKGHITLFRARKQPLLSLDPTLGWRDLAGNGVAVNVIPGTHEKMLEEPNVHILAAELKICLVEAQNAEPGPGRLDVMRTEASHLSDDVITSCSCSIIT